MADAVGATFVKSFRAVSTVCLPPIIFVVLGGVEYLPPTTYPNLEDVRQGAKSIVALLGVVTALAFAFGQTTPSAKTLKGWRRQKRRRDRVNLFTYGSAVGIALFIAMATFAGEW